ncbi:hypothetical protein AOLI_G00309760, partial [Acnodon oligacanthus]
HVLAVKPAPCSPKPVCCRKYVVTGAAERSRVSSERRTALGPSPENPLTAQSIAPRRPVHARSHTHTHSRCAAHTLDKLPLILQRRQGGDEWRHGVI